jgi:hypothetical protein
VRGNLTNINPWLNTSNGTFGATTIVYDTTGTAQNSTNPNGQTTYGHDPTGSFVTGLTPPTPSSGVSLPSSGSYDTAHTGLPLTVTDPNGAQLVYSLYDSLLRPKEIDAKDSGSNFVGKTTFTYPSPFTSLPFGDGYAANIIDSAANQDIVHFAGLDQDGNQSDLVADHAQFRDYSFLLRGDGSRRIPMTAPMT